MSPIHWVGLGTGIPKDRDEFNKREVSECDGWVWELEEIDTPSKFRFTLKADALARMLTHFDFSQQEKPERRKWKYDDPKFDCADWTPEPEKKRSVSLWVCKNKSLIKSLPSTSRGSNSRHKSDSIRWIIIIVRAIFTDLVISSFIQWLIYVGFVCLLWIDEAKANIKPIYECRCNERL